MLNNVISLYHLMLKLDIWLNLPMTSLSHRHDLFHTVNAYTHAGDKVVTKVVPVNSAQFIHARLAGVILYSRGTTSICELPGKQAVCFLD